MIIIFVSVTTYKDIEMAKIQKVTVLKKEEETITEIAVKFSNRRKTNVIKDPELIKQIMIIWIASVLQA